MVEPSHKGEFRGTVRSSQVQLTAALLGASGECFGELSGRSEEKRTKILDVLTWKSSWDTRKLSRSAAGSDTR